MQCYATGHPVSVADVRYDHWRWPRFAGAARDAGFAAVHAVPMRAAGSVLGALGLFGISPGVLDDADLLVAQTLTHIACVAIIQEQSPTPMTVLPQLKAALASRVVIEQAKGFLRERLDVEVDAAFTLLRAYARSRRKHLTDVAAQVMADGEGRTAILAALSEFAR